MKRYEYILLGIFGALLALGAFGKMARAESSDTAYLYEGSAAIIELNVAPCTDAAILEFVSEWAQKYFHEGVGVTRNGKMIPLCWARHTPKIAVATEHGPLPGFIDLHDPRLKTLKPASQIVDTVVPEEPK